MRELICFLGLLLVLEGLPYFLLPKGMKKFMERVPETADGTLRLWGLVAIAAGLFLVYLGKR